MCLKIFLFFSLNGTVFTAGRVVYSASRHVQINLDFPRISNAGGFNNDQSSYQCHVDHSFLPLFSPLSLCFIPDTGNQLEAGIVH